VGKWLKHAQISAYYLRLVRVGRAHYEREINEVMIVELRLDLKEPFDHYRFQGPRSLDRQAQPLFRMEAS